MPSPELVCPTCHESLSSTESSQVLQCNRDGLQFPLIDGIPSFTRALKEPGVLPGCALTVMIPALNEAANLDHILPQLKSALAALGPSHEVLVVDGGSSDGTQDIVRKHGARLISQKRPGFGGAYVAGFEQARGEYLVTLDADGSHDPSVLADLWTGRQLAEVVIASRYVDGGSAVMPRWRRFLSRVLNAAFRRGLSLPVRDLSSGFRLYRTAVLREIDPRASDFDILEEILIRALAAGYRVHEIPF